MTHAFTLCKEGSSFIDGFMEFPYYNGQLITTWMTFIQQYAQMYQLHKLFNESSDYLYKNLFPMDDPLRPIDSFRPLCSIPKLNYDFTIRMFHLELGIRTGCFQPDMDIQTHFSNLANTYTEIFYYPHNIMQHVATLLTYLYTQNQDENPHLEHEKLWDNIFDMINKSGTNDWSERISLIMAMYGLIGLATRYNETVSFLLDQDTVPINQFMISKLFTNLHLLIMIPDPNVTIGLIGKGKYKNGRIALTWLRKIINSTEQIIQETETSSESLPILEKTLNLLQNYT